MTPRSRIALVIAGAIVLVACGIGAYLATHPRMLAPGLPFARSTQPADLSVLRFEDGSGRARSIADYRGKRVVLNLWATWCAPCREEMPALDRLHAALRGSGVEVVALSVDQQGLPIVRRFFGEVGVKSLEPYIDPTAQAAFKLGVVGLPATLLVDADGREIGRHAGAVKWDAPEVVEQLRRMGKAR
jgi:thiol-disulfide isomerase/thioredoxin